MIRVTALCSPQLVFRRNDLSHQETRRDESSCCCLQTCWLSDAINNTGKIAPLKLLPSGSFEVQSWNLLHTHPCRSTQRPPGCVLNLEFRLVVECMFVGDSFDPMKGQDGSLMLLKTENVWLPNVLHCAKCVFSTTQEGQLTFTLNKQSNKLLTVTIVHEVPSVTIIKVFCWVHFCCSCQIKRSLHTPPLLFRYCKVLKVYCLNLVMSVLHV